MKSIFERGTFNAYRITDSRLNEALNETRMLLREAVFLHIKQLFSYHINIVIWMI